jgi:hypothetical protein
MNAYICITLDPKYLGPNVLYRYLPTYIKSIELGCLTWGKDWVFYR